MATLSYKKHIRQLKKNRESLKAWKKHPLVKEDTSAVKWYTRQINNITKEINRQVRKEKRKK